jgi:hypothetical protein
MIISNKQKRNHPEKNGNCVFLFDFEGFVRIKGNLAGQSKLRYKEEEKWQIVSLEQSRRFPS